MEAGYELDGIGLGLYPVADFGISSVLLPVLVIA